MAALQFHHAAEGPVQVIGLEGRLDSNSAADFEKEIAGVSGHLVVLDLAKLEYISSAGLRCVLGALKRLGASGGKLALAAPIPAVLEVFEISGFVTLVAVYPDRASAVGALK